MEWQRQPNEAYSEAMDGPLVKPYITYEDLGRMPPDGNRYEVFDGEVYVMPSPTVRHQRLVRRFARLFEDAGPEGSEVLLAPLDVVLAEATAAQPDVILVLESNREVLCDVIRGAPDLVVEVLSPGTAHRDRGLKMEAYARHGISEYWIADPEETAIEIYRLDREARAYRLVETCREGGVATTPLVPGLKVDVTALFRY